MRRSLYNRHRGIYLSKVNLTRFACAFSCAHQLTEWLRSSYTYITCIFLQFINLKRVSNIETFYACCWIFLYDSLAWFLSVLMEYQDVFKKKWRYWIKVSWYHDLYITRYSCTVFQYCLSSYSFHLIDTT
jgi:hypothetical protein